MQYRITRKAIFISDHYSSDGGFGIRCLSSSAHQASSVLGTDGREVEKKANVYVPYGYSESNQYDILYLLHGTGDDEDYWLITNPYNKTMLDRLIEKKVINPLIIVTPTWYVEDDFKNESLDPLTYSFKDELRNDLMVAVEEKYSTYSEGTTSEAFEQSRNHRAFAGLSRGAVTTMHSVYLECQDYFSYFGCFSGFRTYRDALKESYEKQKEYSINYFYATSGTFDFALKEQIEDYDVLLEEDKRLTKGVNTEFVNFPMRKHSQGNWHLALYNFLQKIF